MREVVFELERVTQPQYKLTTCVGMMPQVMVKLRAVEFVDSSEYTARNNDLVRETMRQ